jgi:hypothetical protein
MKKHLCISKVGIVVTLLLTVVVVYAGQYPADIDIKPNSCPNAINPNSGGRTPVAVLGRSWFDVNWIDPSTVKFGGPGEPGTYAVHHAIKDVNEDGYMDMIFQFRTRDTGIECGDEWAWLYGVTWGGDYFYEEGPIKTTPPY